MKHFTLFPALVVICAQAQKLTEEQYNARFAQDDERYARMLGILRTALARKTT